MSSKDFFMKIYENERDRIIKHITCTESEKTNPPPAEIAKAIKML